jgi:gliding motility-associated-like protein
MFQLKNQIFLYSLLAYFSAHAQCPTGVNTITVTSNAGNNALGTFARACQCVNQSGSTIKTILFNMPGSTVIQPTAAAPLSITANNVLIDGTSQSGVVVDGGSAAGPSSQGIIVTGDGNTIQGLTIQNFTATAGGNAIWLGPGSSATIITNNTLHNNRNGVFMTDGGVSTALISGNSIFCNAVEGINRGTVPPVSLIVANTQRIRGMVNTPNADVEVFFDDKTGCAGAPCQGKTFIGAATADATGKWELAPSAGVLQPADVVVATSTANGNNTSEFTTCAVVSDCSALDANIAKTDIACFGDANGMATASATGFSPIAAPAFLWSNGLTTTAINNLSPGTFTVTVTDAAGCTATATVDIIQPAALANTFTSQNVKCFGGNDGLLTAVPAGGTTPYMYLWSNNGMSATINNLAAGIYTVTITDAHACMIIRNTQLTQPALLTAGASATNESAAGANDGTATATAGGGTPGYTYLWSNTATTPNINNLGPGTYTVTITDTNFCVKTASATVGAGPGGGPCSALPVYAVLGPAQVCGNSTLSLEVDDLYPNAAVVYVWYFPNGDSTETLLPTLDLLVTSTDFSGEYFVVRDSAGCRSIPVGGAPVTVLSLDPGLVFAGTDTLLCAAGAVVLKAVPPPQGTGAWVSLGSATIDDPSDIITVARNLQTGANAFVWQVSLGTCTAAASDTVVYFLEKRAVLNDDRYTQQHAQDIAVMEVLLNDALAGLPDTVVTQLGAPSVGILEYLESGKRFRYTVDEDFRGTVQFQYVVCSPASACNLPCDTALVTIEVQNLPSVPEGLVVEDPGPNGRLTIKGISGFSRVEIAIFNRWGSLVFQENDYHNDVPWLGYFQGKALPQGAYYYYLKAWEGNTLVGGTLTGIVHLFSQN